ncbi:MAG TPA: flagellar basal body-associated FliL family protein [Planctomycetes bacterium]|nr:flagellar basal body-associated FliL family protein [Fuerstiella sp.]HIK92395.1 flagellar basal body-associated FliL family protein [Planctomycetota bacterium]
MAEEAKKKDEEEEGDGAGKGSPLPWILVTLLCGGMGMAIPYLMPAAEAPGAEEQPEPVFEILDPEDTAFVPFDAVVVNLDEGALTRFLRVAVTLQVPKEEEESIKLKMEEKKAVLKNWLINQISDKNLEEIRGGAGQNRLRREVRDQFNTVLFPDGYDRIYNVLFDEYNVQ